MMVKDLESVHKVKIGTVIRSCAIYDVLGTITEVNIHTGQIIIIWDVKNLPYYHTYSSYTCWKNCGCAIVLSNDNYFFISKTRR